MDDLCRLTSEVGSANPLMPSGVEVTWITRGSRPDDFGRTHSATRWCPWPWGRRSGRRLGLLGERRRAASARHGRLPTGARVLPAGGGGDHLSFQVTTLARMVCGDRRVRRRFGRRVYLVTVGRDVRGPAAVAAKINDVIKLVTGTMLRSPIHRWRASSWARCWMPAHAGFWCSLMCGSRSSWRRSPRAGRDVLGWSRRGRRGCWPGEAQRYRSVR